MSNPFDSSNAEHAAAAGNIRHDAPSSTDLGPLVNEYRGRGLWALVLGSICLLAAIWCFVAGASGAPEYIFLGGLALPVAVGLFIRAWGVRSRRVTVFQNGAVFQDWHGKVAVIWTQFGTVRQKIATSQKMELGTITTYKVWFTLPGGRRFLVDAEMSHYSELVDEVQQKISLVRLPILLANFRKNETVAFGKFLFDSTGLTYGSTRLTWNEIEYFYNHDGELRVQRKGDKRVNPLQKAAIAVNISGVPDLALMLDFVDRIRSG